MDPAVSSSLAGANVRLTCFGMTRGERERESGKGSGSLQQNLAWALDPRSLPLISLRPLGPVCPRSLSLSPPRSLSLSISATQAALDTLEAALAPYLGLSLAALDAKLEAGEGGEEGEEGKGATSGAATCAALASALAACARLAEAAGGRAVGDDLARELDAVARAGRQVEGTAGWPLQRGGESDGAAPWPPPRAAATGGGGGGGFRKRKKRGAGKRKRR